VPLTDTYSTLAASDERALAHALAIATATSEDELVDRTLMACLALTDAVLAAMLDPAGVLVCRGDAVQIDQLRGILPADKRKLRAHPGGPTADLAHVGLPCAVASRVGALVLLIAHPHPGKLSGSAERLLRLIAANASAGLDRLGEIAALRREAESDPLTGLRHQVPFGERLATAVPGHTAIIVIDVDGFKQINDEYGHLAGDRALLALVEALSAALRSGDELYRIGGDEFAVVLDVGGEPEAQAVGQRLLEAARSSGQTVSVGAAVREPGESPRETLARADQALYAAKRAGRDTYRPA
jgi:diguanylate cyclase (GGDEF)-like protein